MSDDVRLGIVGGGQMGGGIAEVAARAGVDVRIAEASDALAEQARTRIDRSLDKAVERGKSTSEERDGARERLSYTSELSDLSDRTHVIEAAVENEGVKRDLFTRLDEIVTAQDAVLATNTSSIPVTRLAGATTRPGAVIGIHFFNPVQVMRLVELIPTELTSDETRERARALAQSVLGKEPIWAPDRAGFVVNALLVPFLLSAIRMLESGVASAEDIDHGMVAGCNHPIGPLALTDLIGLDTTLFIAETLSEEYREPQYTPPVLLRRKVEAGLLGRKSGRGFYDY